MGLATFDTFQPSRKPFLIPDLLSPWITLLSGKAKSRKSFLAGYMVEGLLMGSPVLGREPAPGNHSVYWAGFDSGWQEELHERWNGRPWLKQLVYDEGDGEPAKRSEQDWVLLGSVLASRGVSLAVIDHLYGFSRGADIDKAHGARAIWDAVRDWPTTHGISLLVLAHAGGGFKGADGSAAHSYANEAEARHLLRLASPRGGVQELKVSGNSSPELRLRVRIGPEACDLIGGSSEAEPHERELPDDVWALLEGPQQDRSSAAAAGRRLDPENPKAGRAKVNRWLKRGLLARAEDGRSLVVGPNLPPRAEAA